MPRSTEYANPTLTSGSSTGTQPASPLAQKYPNLAAAYQRGAVAQMRARFKQLRAIHREGKAELENYQSGSGPLAQHPIFKVLFPSMFLKGK